MKLSLYLFRQSAKEFDALLREKYRVGNDAFTVIRPSEPLPFECCALVQQNKAKPPKWIQYLAPSFDLNELELQNQSNSFILLLRAKERIFGVTFGYAFNAIDPALIEPDFGLRTTLNEVDHANLDTVQTRNIDVVTKQRRTHLNQGSPIAEFGLNPDLDWIRHVSGIPIAESLANRMAGADSLHITTDLSLPKLGELCEKLLASYEADRYLKHFGFIDRLRPVKDTDPIVRKLNKKLIALLTGRDRTNVAVAHPDFPDPSTETYRICSLRESHSCAELTMKEVYAFQAQAFPSGNMDPEKVSVIALDSDDAAVSRRTPLRNYLVAQVEDAGHTYVLSLARWFRVASDYIEQLRSQIAKIDDITSILSLPSIEHAEREEKYNSRVSSSNGWMLLDKKMFTFQGQYQKIEACDLLTQDRQFICVKKMDSSATLSHLFSQGSVSATLLKKEPSYKNSLAQLYEQKWKGQKFDNTGSVPTFVYAISTDRPGRLADELFFFSLVNLAQHADAVRLLGFNVALCKIEHAPLMSESASESDELESLEIPMGTLESEHTAL